jgi:hypothetical protein
LSKAQPNLAKIHALDGSSSSSEGSRRRPGSDPTISMSSSQEERHAAHANEEAELRLHTGEYVEARGILLPAVEYLRRAVDEAEKQGTLNGHLLITVMTTPTQRRRASANPTLIGCRIVHESRQRIIQSHQRGLLSPSNCVPSLGVRYPWISAASAPAKVLIFQLDGLIST